MRELGLGGPPRYFLPGRSPKKSRRYIAIYSDYRSISSFLIRLDIKLSSYQCSLDIQRNPLITFIDYFAIAIASRKNISLKKSSKRKRRVNTLLKSLRDNSSKDSLLSEAIDILNTSTTSKTPYLRLNITFYKSIILVLRLNVFKLSR